MPRTGETESGLWATPNTSDQHHANMKGDHDIKKGYLRGQVKMWPTPDCSDRRSAKSKQQGLSNKVKAIEATKMWPTPDANMGNRGTQPTWTPQRPSGHHASYTLNQAAQDSQKLWPTPRQFMHKDSTTDRGKGNLGEKVGGQLNADWVSLLMGYPADWTVVDGNVA